MITFCNFLVLLAPSWNKRNRKSAHLVAALRHGRLKECNQTRPLSVFFFWGGGGGGCGWDCNILISNLETYPTAPEYFGVWILEKAWQISCQFMREWNRSLKIVRLGKSVTNHRAYYKQWNRKWNKNTCRCYISFGCRFFFETFAFRSANQRSPIQVSPLPHPHPLQTTSHLHSLE